MGNTQEQHPTLVAAANAEPALVEPKARTSTSAPANASIQSNYQYWREHGHEWSTEYDSRKRVQPYYHIQEMMLAEYIREHARIAREAGASSLRVLEFGCGVGRHLQNLRRLPNVDIRGHDQSASMVGECRLWATQEWISEHITIGLPTGRLPYRDGEFDIVYTSEVLMHVRPEDLPGILRELLRVSSGQVFHIETSPAHKLVTSEHDGCWWHDLPVEYGHLGVECVMLGQGYSAHAPYRVIRDASRQTWTWPGLLLSLFRRMETDLDWGFNILRGDLVAWKDKHRTATSSLEQARSEAAAAGLSMQAAEAALRRVQSELDETRAALDRANSELDALTTKLGDSAAALDLALAQHSEAAARASAAERLLAQIRYRADRLDESMRRRIAALETDLRSEQTRTRDLSLRQAAFVDGAERQLRR